MIHVSRRKAWGAASWLALSLPLLTVSCGNAGGPFQRTENFSNGTGGQSGVICPTIVSADPPMIYPANGATGVPTTIGVIYFSGSASVYSQGQIELTASPGGAGSRQQAPGPVAEPRHITGRVRSARARRGS